MKQIDNIFSNPEIYLKEIIEKVSVPKEKRRKFEGKSLASIFPTKFCDAGCAHCFFKSGKTIRKSPQEQYEFSDYGIDKFIEFINQSNNGYLLVIGGGEPFKKYEQVLKIVQQVKTDRLILVTNGMWAQNYEEAKKTIFELYTNFKKRKTETKLILRLSTDKWHAKQLGYELINHIIDIYKKYFRDEENFELQLHTLIGDDVIEKVAEKRKDFEIIRTNETGISDNEEVIKISPYRCRLNFEDGYVIYVGIAKTFYSTLKPNLMKEEKVLKEAIQIFDDDMEFSAFDNPSVIRNKNGTLGLNFWVNYNGNVALWGNQQLTDLKNLYCDSYEDIINANFSNIISYSFLDKGYKNRVRIIEEVNHKAVIRSKAINIRDYAGASILEEKKTTLYYAIRVIQDYLKENIITGKDLKNLSAILLETMNLNTQNLIKLYQTANYSIIDEYMKKEKFVKEEWEDLFELIKLGHYDVTEKQIQEGINFYEHKIQNGISPMLNEQDNAKAQYERLNEKITFMKKEAMDFCKNKNCFPKERFKTPSAVILMLIRNINGKEQILLQKRKNTGFMDGYYDFGASGHVEDKETMKMALIREAKEEIGIKIDERDVEFVTMLHDIHKNIYFNAYFKVTKWEGDPRISEVDKIEEIKWFDIDNLPNNLIENRRKAIKNYKDKIFYSEIK